MPSGNGTRAAAKAATEQEQANQDALAQAAVQAEQAQAQAAADEAARVAAEQAADAAAKAAEAAAALAQAAVEAAPKGMREAAQAQTTQAQKRATPLVLAHGFAWHVQAGIGKHGVTVETDAAGANPRYFLTWVPQIGRVHKVPLLNSLYALVDAGELE